MGAGEKQQGGGGEAAQNGKQEHALHRKPSSDRLPAGPHGDLDLQGDSRPPCSIHKATVFVARP